MDRKSLYEISWQVPESVYRQDNALSYSTLAKYYREGFNKIDTLFDKVSSPSLTFGSMVDALITGGQEEFDRQFIVAEFPTLKPNIMDMVKELYARWNASYPSLSEIPNDMIITLSEEKQFQLNWKPETRARVIKESGEEYYSLLRAAGDKTVVNTDTMNEVMASVRALKESSATGFYFQDNDPFDTRYAREYQLKFKASLNGIGYRCMADLLLTDYEKMIIYPIDLKTSSHTEWDFYRSFVEWSYAIQARLYWRIIRDNLDNDSYFRDFALADYRFIVVNKSTLTPLVWEYPDTAKEGELRYYNTRNGNPIIVPDPEDIGNELVHYLKDAPRVPDNIKLDKPNNIIEWLTK